MAKDDDLYQVPLHATSTRRRVERCRGRARTVAKRPVYRQADREQWLRQQLDEHVDDDAVVRAARAPGRALIDEVCEQLAREAAGLEWERRKQTPGSREAERTSSRRVRALSDLARMVLVREEFAGKVDLRDSRVQRIVEMFITRVQSVVREVLPPDTAARVIDAWRKATVGWEDEIG